MLTAFRGLKARFQTASRMPLQGDAKWPNVGMKTRSLLPSAFKVKEEVRSTLIIRSAAAIGSDQFKSPNRHWP